MSIIRDASKHGDKTHQRSEYHSHFLRFGLYNNGGTPFDTDFNQSSTNDDVGYFHRVNYTGGSSAIIKEAAGDNFLGGTIQGPTINLIGSAYTASTNTLPHSYSLRLVRNALGGIDFAATLDGVTHTGTDATPVVATFHELGIGMGQGIVDMYIDNVTVTSSAAPEPTSMGLIGLTGMAFAGVVQRRR
jgi:hypothetical protein